jgi:hypothetical protein
MCCKFLVGVAGLCAVVFSASARTGSERIDVFLLKDGHAWAVLAGTQGASDPKDAVFHPETSQDVTLDNPKPPGLPGLPPSDFLLLDPPDGGDAAVVVPIGPHDVYDFNIQFDWVPSIGASYYEVYLSEYSPPDTFVGRTDVPVFHQTTFEGDMYWWKVVAVNSNGRTSSSTRMFWSCRDPWNGADWSAPSPAPADQATGVPLSASLSWTVGRARRFNVYFGTANPPPRVGSIDPKDYVNTYSDKTFHYYPTGLTTNTKYYWRVEAYNPCHGEVDSSPTWSFTTTAPRPDAPTLGYPPNGATDVPNQAVVDWSYVDGATGYEVCVDTFPNPNHCTNPVTLNYYFLWGSHTIFTLQYNTTYYWRVDAENIMGSASSETRSFTTAGPPPRAPTLILPANGAQNSPLAPVLRWTTQAGATRYRVFLGPYCSLPNGSCPPLPAVGVPTAASLQLSPLNANATYVWYVVAQDGNGGSDPSPSFSFSTGPPVPGPATLISPANGLSDVPMGSSLSWSAPANAAYYEVYFGTSNPPRRSGTSVTNSLTLSNAAANAKYYWYVVACNSSGCAQPSPTWSFTTNATPAANLALGKTATQSSTYPGYSTTGAGSAVDGNTDGNFLDGSVSHTNLDANAWWQVDLGASATINSVIVWGRTDCCGSRLSDYWVFISNTPFNATDTPATLQSRAGTWSSHQTSMPNPFTSIPAGVTGRYVRIQLSGTNYLSLAEVQVMGTVGSLPTYSISGQVVLSGTTTGLSGVNVALSGGTGASTTTDGSGSYAFSGLASGGNYTVTPSLTGYTFTPTSRGFSNLSASQTQNFTAAAVPVGSNLAVGKTATQSSTYPGYSTAGPGSAVDGNTDGNFLDGSVSHTNDDVNAWWQVDLGASATINSVVVWNRTDCCSSRLSDYWVFVSNTPFSATDTPATLQSRAGTFSSHQTSAPAPSTTIPFSSALGRYVRVQLSGTNYLALAEVQVIGTIVTDVALGKTATQSSTYPGYSTAGPGSAVDGNTDGNFLDGSVSHTNDDANAWWQVDLGASATINSVIVWGRTDCCSSRLSDYWVFVSNTPFSATDTPATLQSRAGTWSSHQTSMPNPSTSISAGVTGRYVRIQLSGTDYLSLAEVQVMGTIP